jgi:hypothetical protein
MGPPMTVMMPPLINNYKNCRHETLLLHKYHSSVLHQQFVPSCAVTQERHWSKINEALGGAVLERGEKLTLQVRLALVYWCLQLQHSSLGFTLDL